MRGRRRTLGLPPSRLMTSRPKHSLSMGWAVSVFHLVSPVTNGTVSPPTRYGLANVPFVVRRPCPLASDGLGPVPGGVVFQVVKTAQSRGRTERTLLTALSQLSLSW